MRTEYLLQREVDMVLSALTPVNRVVCRVMLHTGLRVGDVLALRPEQIRPKQWITEIKTGKRRQIGLTQELMEDMRAVCGTEWVFPGRVDASKHRTRQAVWADVKRAAKAFRLPQNVGSHSMRKVYAVELLHRYGDIARVQRALRHSDPMVTAIYAMADQQLQARFRRRGRRPKSRS